MPGEFDLINWIAAQQTPSALIPVPVGDDLAVLRWVGEDLLLVGVDQVLDGVHFDSSIHSPRQIGRKVMNRNLSDCAAMACLPAAALTTAALPWGMSLEYAQELYVGMREAGAQFDCPIVGGDTASWEGKLVMTVTILGRSAGIAPVTRRGAKPGDGIYVTGPLGGSILGRHMDFVPRIELARRLAQTDLLTAMIDISDGLSRDLDHICKQSKVGALVEAEAIPIHADAIELARQDNRSALDHALHDGEDHELLFTARAAPPDAVRIGRIVEGTDIALSRQGRAEPLAAAGWEHRF
jgi:thiamine-monophosphate kinase